MDFSLTESQDELSALARQIPTDRATPARLAELEPGRPGHSTGAVGRRWPPRASWLPPLPETAGGGGYGLLEQCSILTEIGRAVAPVPYLTAIVLGAGAIATFGAGEQVQALGRPGRGRATWSSPPRWPRTSRDDPPSAGSPGPAYGRDLAAERDEDHVPAGTSAELSSCPPRPSDGPAVFSSSRPTPA